MRGLTVLSTVLLAVLMGSVVAHAGVVVYPDDVAGYTNPPVGVWGDYAPGWGMGSWQANGYGVTELYATPELLFGRAVTLGEIESISFWTKNEQLHSVSAPDWFFTIYTQPFGSSWYGLRLIAEPYFAENINETAGEWVKWDTAANENKLRFFVSGVSGSAVSNGSFAELFAWGDIPPNWDALRSAHPDIPADLYAQEVKYFRLSTATGWADTFTGLVDGIEIRLNSGQTAGINLEAVPEPSTLAAVLAGIGCVASLSVVRGRKQS